MISQDARTLAGLIRAQFGLHRLLPHLVRLLSAAGEPVTIEHTAASGGWTVRQVRTELDRHPGVDWHTDGRIVGFGATLRPTPHRFIPDQGRTIYGFCASDALTYPVILDQPGVIDSICPVTGRHIRVDATPDRVTSTDPTTTVVSRIRPDTAVADVRAEICALGSFFASADDAADWQAHHSDGTLVPVREDFEVNREAMIELGWTAGYQRDRALSPPSTGKQTPLT
jgi:alkylmercury lyase